MGERMCSLMDSVLLFTPPSLHGYPQNPDSPHRKPNMAAHMVYSCRPFRLLLIILNHCCSHGNSIEHQKIYIKEHVVIVTRVHLAVMMGHCFGFLLRWNHGNHVVMEMAFFFFFCKECMFSAKIVVYIWSRELGQLDLAIQYLPAHEPCCTWHLVNRKYEQLNYAQCQSGESWRMNVVIHCKYLASGLIDSWEALSWHQGSWFLNVTCMLCLLFIGRNYFHPWKNGIIFRKARWFLNKDVCVFKTLCRFIIKT